MEDDNGPRSIFLSQVILCFQALHAHESSIVHLSLSCAALLMEHDPASVVWSRSGYPGILGAICSLASMQLIAGASTPCKCERATNNQAEGNGVALHILARNVHMHLGSHPTRLVLMQCHIRSDMGGQGPLSTKKLVTAWRIRTFSAHLKQHPPVQ